MPNPLDPTQATRLDLDTYYADFQKEFAASSDFWKLERSQHAAEPSNASWVAFNHGNWHEALELLDTWKEELKPVHQRNTAGGTRVHRIRIVERPFTPYTQWELELLWRRNAVTGGIFIIGDESVDTLEAGGKLPDLNIMDNVMYHVTYDQHGVIHYADKYTDTAIVHPWRDLTKRLWDEGIPMAHYYERYVKGLPAPQVSEQLPDDYLEQHGRPRQGMS